MRVCLEKQETTYTKTSLKRKEIQYMEGITVLQSKFYQAVEELRRIEAKVKSQEDIVRNAEREENENTITVESLSEKRLELEKSISFEFSRLENIKLKITNMEYKSDLLRKQLEIMIPNMMKMLTKYNIDRNICLKRLQSVISSSQAHKSDISEELLKEKYAYYAEMRPVDKYKLNQHNELVLKVRDQKEALEYLHSCINAFTKRNTELRRQIDIEKAKPVQSLNYQTHMQPEYNERRCGYITNPTAPTAPYMEYDVADSFSDDIQHSLSSNAYINDTANQPWYCNRKRKLSNHSYVVNQEEFHHLESELNSAVVDYAGMSHVMHQKFVDVSCYSSVSSKVAHSRGTASFQTASELLVQEEDRIY